MPGQFQTIEIGRRAFLTHQGALQTIGDFYNGLIEQMGIESSTAKSVTKNCELLINQLENAKQSVEGVSLDEEMTNLIKFQHSYDAAARVITAMDEVLGTVIVKMGIVGR